MTLKQINYKQKRTPGIGNSRSFLPTSEADMKARGWDELDFLCITGDAYIDHPSFGHAIVSRYLESLGYRVGIVAQPDWRNSADFSRMGRPRLAVLLASGNLDSMLSNYSTRGKRRREDAYSPGGVSGKRPDRAVIVYSNRIRELWKDVPLIIGGIEASLRRMSHYDYWANDVRRSILVDSRADILTYGMCETQLKEIAARLNAGEKVSTIRDIPGTCWKTHDLNDAPNAVILPTFEMVRDDKSAFAEAFKLFYLGQNFAQSRQLAQDNGSWFVIHNPPPPPLSTDQMDSIYSLPYARASHPSYKEKIPALEEVRFSITSHRGCFGECSFCAISSHQGRIIQPRSVANIIKEAEQITAMPDFKGYIHDVGGPTANFRTPACAKQMTAGACLDRSCLYPKPCRHLRTSHSEYIELLKAVRGVRGVKKVFVRSGLRYDYILADPKGDEFLKELCMHHISGQLKIAPEHISPTVLAYMKKSSKDVTERFIRAYRAMNSKLGMKQFLVPYFMSAHPGCGLKESLELAEFVRDMGIRAEQAQEFTPTPGTVATCMYHTGLDPFTGESVSVESDYNERSMQRALLQYWMPQNHDLVRSALRKLGRCDLIGNSPKCLIRDEPKQRRSESKRRGEPRVK